MVEVLLYVHRNRRFIRDGSLGRPPRLSHSSWALRQNENNYKFIYSQDLPSSQTSVLQVWKQECMCQCPDQVRLVASFPPPCTWPGDIRAHWLRSGCTVTHSGYLISWAKRDKAIFKLKEKEMKRFVFNLQLERITIRPSLSSSSLSSSSSSSSSSLHLSVSRTVYQWIH